MVATLFPLALVIAFSMIPYSLHGWPEHKASDSFPTEKGTVEIVFLGHSSLILSYDGVLLYIDPVSQYAHFSEYPKADLILVTHEHYDHLDPQAIAALSKPQTRIILPQACQKKLGKGEVLRHGQSLEVAGLTIAAVPAYNVTPERLGYHPKERGDNGYIISAGSLHIYIAGDTEPIPEMATLGPIDIAFYR